MQPVSPSSDMPKGYRFNFHNNFYKSPWVQFIGASALIMGLSSRVSWSKGFLTPRRISLVAMGILGTCLWKSLVFEALLVMNVAKNRLGIWEWCSCIDGDRGIYLGALPLEEMGYKEWLNQFAVLSIVESFEEETTTIVGKCVQFDRTREQIKKIDTPDFVPLSIENLDQAADWIDEQVKNVERRRILIHCKSGVGRSASALAAYYIKYEKKTVEEARNFMAGKRPYIFKPGSQHMKRLEEFAKQKPSSSSNPCLSNVCKQQ